MSSVEDAEIVDEFSLLQRAAAGEEHAVKWLFRAHLGLIHRTCARILGPSDPDLEDVVQKVFLAALKGASRFDERSKVSTWLVGIATRRALDQARVRYRRNRWRSVKESVGLGRAASRPDTRHHALREAHAALAQLTPDQRTVFVLHAVEGYTFKEIQEMTGVGISTLHARLKAARKRLDKLVSEGDDGGNDGAAA
jgi:RNA polymerase sigma-70 factor (ECF subfamily)